MNKLTKYGTEYFGKLKKVLIHKPIRSLELINKQNCKYYLFDELPDIEKFLAEHETYTALLKSLNIEVHELSNYVHDNIDLMNKLPSLTYLHDSSVITSHGAILSRMVAAHGRQFEEIVLKEALSNLGIPIFHEFNHGDTFEGCLLLSPDTIFIANTERHSKATIEKFFEVVLRIFPKIIYVEIPQARRFMHPDMIYNRINPNLSLVYLPAILQAYLITKESKTAIDFKQYMHSQNIELINISDEEQQKWGCSFVPLKPNNIINYDISFSPQTIKILQGKGVEIISLHPEALLAGGGSLRCLTLRLLRE